MTKKKKLSGQPGQRELTAHGSLVLQVNASLGDSSQLKDSGTPGKLDTVPPWIITRALSARLTGCSRYPQVTVLSAL